MSVSSFEDGSYYTEHVKEINSCVKQYMQGVQARYTRLLRPNELVYIKEFTTLRGAPKTNKEDKHALDQR